jgi:hypothetical protein
MSLHVRQLLAELPLIMGAAAGFSFSVMTVVFFALKILRYGAVCDRPMRPQPAHRPSPVWRERRVRSGIR